MTEPLPLFSQFASRKAFFGIDARATAMLVEMWPGIRNHVYTGLDVYFEKCLLLPPVAQRILPHRERIRTAYFDHFELVLNSDFGDTYLRSLKRKRSLEVEIGIEDVRTHLSISCFVLEAITGSILRSHRFASGAVDPSKLLISALAFDALTAVALIVDEIIQNSDSRRREIDAAIDDFDSTLGNVVDAIRSSSRSLGNASIAMDMATETTLNSMHDATSAAQTMRESVAVTAAATEELSSSMGEIRRQAFHGSERAESAATDIEAMKDAVRYLSEATEHIGSVVKIISGFASQTNLLALNASIEAARAGPAGRGFAVVANEVKELAKKTTLATEDIGRQISRIRDATKQTAASAGSVVNKVVELTLIATNIAAAVDEQSVAIEEIDRNMQTASAQSALATAAVDAFGMTARQSKLISAEVAEWTRVLSAKADDLATNVKSFFAQVRP